MHAIIVKHDQVQIMCKLAKIVSTYSSSFKPKSSSLTCASLLQAELFLWHVQFLASRIGDRQGQRDKDLNILLYGATKMVHDGRMKGPYCAS